MWCVTPRDGRPFAKTEALKLSSLANEVNSNARCDFSFAEVVESVVNFNAAFKKENCLSFLAAHLADLIENMVSFDFLPGARSQTYLL